MVHDSCASLFLDASTVSTVFPCQYNKTFYLEQHKLHFSKFYFLDFYKKKLKYIMQDLDGKRLNSAVNLGKMLWTGCCLFYDRVYEFLWAQKTFYCTPTPVLEPSMVRVCFFTRAALKNLKKKKKKINLRSRLCLKCHRSSLRRQVGFVINGSFSSWTINHDSHRAGGMRWLFTRVTPL